MIQVRWGAPLLAALLITAAGCGSDDDDNNGTPRPTATRTSTRTPTTVPTSPPATPTAGGPTLTPTATQIPAATNTPGGFAGAETVQKFVSGVLGSIAGLSDLAGGGSSGQLQSGRAALVLPPIPVPCTNGGTTTIGCTASGTGSDLTFTFAQCRNRGGGAETYIDGLIAIDSPAGCPGVPLPTGQAFGVDVDARIESTAGGKTTAGDFDVLETVTLGADGSATVDASGSVDTECTGAVSFETIEPLVYPADAACGTGGAIRVMLDGGDSIVRLTSGGGVEIDYGADGSVDESYARCTDAALASCD
jgi:hypothetical protein